jgi:hypothetical protein
MYGVAWRLGYVPSSQVTHNIVVAVATASSAASTAATAFLLMLFVV